MRADARAASELSVAAYNDGWTNQWDDMKKYGPFSRHLRRLIVNLVRPLVFESVLDVGCGQGALLAELQRVFPHIRPYGIDLSEAAIALARVRVRGGNFGVCNLAREHLERQFDLVICSEVLEHIQDDVAAIRNLAAMTGKYVVVTTPQGRMRSSETLMGHVRNYRRDELLRQLVHAGLQPSQTIEWGFPFYSPLYRDFLEWTGNRGTSGKYGVTRKLLATLLYGLFALNSSKRGDELLVLATPRRGESL